MTGANEKLFCSMRVSEDDDECEQDNGIAVLQLFLLKMQLLVPMAISATQ